MTSVRIDKWLWAARFFKTRALASKACDLGRITANGADVTLIVGELIARKPAVNVRNVELNGNRVDISTANARRDAFGAAVAKRMKDEGLSYDDAFAKCYTDPALAGLTGAMGDPTKK